RVPTNEQIETMARAPDGKVVVASGYGAPAILARYLPDGSLDPTFGHGGYLTDVAVGAGAAVKRLTIDAASRILAIAATDYDGYLVRFTPGGTPDPTFGNGGTVHLDFPAYRMLPLDGGKL